MASYLHDTLAVCRPCDTSVAVVAWISGETLDGLYESLQKKSLSRFQMKPFFFFFEWQAGDAKIFKLLTVTLSDALPAVYSRLNVLWDTLECNF